MIIAEASGQGTGRSDEHEKPQGGQESEQARRAQGEDRDGQAVDQQEGENDE
jgi:hypothetical protein